MNTVCRVILLVWLAGLTGFVGWNAHKACEWQEDAKHRFYSVGEYVLLNRDKIKELDAEVGELKARRSASMQALEADIEMLRSQISSLERAIQLLR